MRKVLGALAAVAVLSIAAEANAEAWYVGGYGGLNYTHDGNVNAAGVDASYDLGLALGAYAGFFVQDNARLEADLSYRANDLDSRGGVAIAGEAETTALLVNALFDISLESAVQPHIGAGIGIAEVDYRIGNGQFDDTVLAFQLIVGADIEIVPATNLTLDYRLFVTEDLNVGGGVGFGSVEYINSAFLVGLRRSF